ncbi:MAG TPA: YfhO family protein [Candidatus Wujingus californicus]|uniref:YfhO family protein n=1 Tax=Candidatus Wujingus californicus TaxID=3367618 RepID=UPI004027DC63
MSESKNKHIYPAPYLNANQYETWSKYDWFAILTLFLLTLAYFHNVVIPTNYSVLSDQNTDTRHQLFYWRYFGFNTLAKGTLPLWNPYIYGGTPFVGGLQSALFYPLNLIYLILPTYIAINYSIILHVFLSGVFTYLYLRYIKLSGTNQINENAVKSIGINRLSRPSCVIASIIFMFCAPQIFHIYPGHLPNLCTMIWLPLILLFSELFIRNRNFSYAIFGGITVAFNILAGHPQYFFYTAIAVVIYFIIRIVQGVITHRNWKYAGYQTAGFFIIYTVGILLSSIQLLPAFEMVKHSVRQALSYEWVGQFSFAPENFLTLIIPEFFGDSLRAPYWGRYYLWEMSLYIGILPLMLCGLASFYFRNKFTKTFLIIALITTIFALGKFTPLFKFLYHFVPGFNLFRGNSKFIFIVAFSLSVLSGIGAEYLLNNSFIKKNKSIFFYITIGIISAIGLFLLAFFLFKAGYESWHNIIRKVYLLGDRYTILPDLKDKGFLSTTFAITTNNAIKFIVLTILSLLILGVWFNGVLKKKFIIPLTIALIFWDLWFFGNQYMVTFDSRLCFWDKDLVNVLKNDSEPLRITTHGNFELNQGMVHDISNVGGYDANIIKEYSEFIQLSNRKPIDEPNIYVEVTQFSKLTNMLNLKYILLPSNVRIEHPTIKHIFNNSKYALFQNTMALPRAFIVHSAKTLNGRDAIFKELASKEFDPLKYAILEEPSKLTQNANQENIEQEPPPTILEYSPNRVKIKVNMFEDGYLVLGDTFYPGWNAYIDGRKTRIYKTNYVLRSVFLEKGEHLAAFVYEPKSFSIGMIISITSLVILIPVSIFKIRRH